MIKYNVYIERLNVTIVDKSKTNPFLLTPEKEMETLKLFDSHRHLLTVPRRPYWDASTTPDQLQAAEKSAFLEWRRGLVSLEEEKGLLMTPYERNLDIWRQLWRVIERSDLVVQIVDARNPFLFRCADLESLVLHIDSRKQNLLLINKADMLSLDQRYHFI